MVITNSISLAGKALACLEGLQKTECTGEFYKDKLQVSLSSTGEIGYRTVNLRSLGGLELKLLSLLIKFYSSLSSC